MSSEFDFLLLLFILFMLIMTIFFINLSLRNEIVTKINSMDKDLTILWYRVKNINKKKGGNEK